MSITDFKVSVDPLLSCFIACVQWISQIHIWCDVTTADLLAVSMAAESF